MEERRNTYVVSIGKPEESRLFWRLRVDGVLARKWVLRKRLIG
jgi:hypothetical protein